MEQFNNNGMECVVLKREGTHALVAIISNTLAPFVVPTEHRKGDSEWWGGRYFKTLDAALEYYNSEL